MQEKIKSIRMQTAVGVALVAIFATSSLFASASIPVKQDACTSYGYGGYCTQTDLDDANAADKAAADKAAAEKAAADKAAADKAAADEQARIQTEAALVAANEVARVAAVNEAERIQAENEKIAQEKADKKKADKKKKEKDEKKKKAAQKIAVKKVAEFGFYNNAQSIASYKTVSAIKKSNPARFRTLESIFKKYNTVGGRLNVQPNQQTLSAINMFRSYSGYSIYLNHANKLKK